MTSLFNKILLVKKTTKFERMKSSGRAFSPYIENVLMKVWYHCFILNVKGGGSQCSYKRRRFLFKVTAKYGKGCYYAQGLRAKA